MQPPNFSTPPYPIAMRPVTRSLAAVTIAALLAGLVTPLTSGEPASPPGSRRADPRPNLVVIMADDVGYEGVSAYGSASYRTPELDRLAAGGVRFTHCYSQPLCTPSRVQIMTGKYNHRNYTRFGELRPGEVTFANVLKDAGYRTCIAGKWQLGGDGDSVRGFGFETYCLWHIQGRESRYWEPRIVENDELRTDVADRFGPDVMCEFVTRFIAAQRERPFLVYYPMVLPHWPFVPTPDSRPGGSRERSGRYDGQAGGTEYFPDMVAHIDKIVGRIDAQLGRCGVRDQTLLLFTADNGCATNIVSRMGDGEIHGGKSFMTDAGTHAPLVVSWPGTIREGRRSDALVDLSDVLPTLVDAAGASMPEGLGSDGHSLVPHLRTGAPHPREWVFCHYLARPPAEPTDAKAREKALRRQAAQRAKKKVGRFVRTRRFKLYDDGRLYDVSADVLEERPIPPGEGPPEARAARTRLRKLLGSFPPWSPFGRPSEPPPGAP